MAPKKRHYQDTHIFRDHLTHQHQQGNHDWHPWPEQHKLSKGSRNVYRTRVRTGAMWGEGFEARIRGGMLECRYQPE